MISFVYVTCRKDPKLEWFIDALYNQIKINNFDINKIQIVIVDYELQYDKDNLRKYMIEKIINNRFDFIHVPPKPSNIQGIYKLTKINYFSCSLARNTGICYVKYDYVAFIDDLSTFEEGSFAEIVKCASLNIVVGFAYKKVNNLSVIDGKIVSKTEHAGGIDSRWNGGDIFRKISGSQLYGYSASPLSIILKINGYDEICNTMGGEDYHYGMRIDKLNIPIYYNRRVVFYESEEFADQGNVFIRRDPLLSKELYLSLMSKFNVTNRYVNNARYDLSHFILDLLTRNKSWTEGNDYNISELRNKIQEGGEFNSIFDPNTKTLDDLFLKDI
jgi:hypothetical protein